MGEIVDDDEFEYDDFEEEDGEIVLECETSGESSEDDDELGEIRARIAVRGAEPYMFEPPARNRQEQENNQVDDGDRFAGRRQTLDW